ncbi:MAG: ATP-dependent DNA helicase RecG [Parcubacteria group bacterium]
MIDLDSSIDTLSRIGPKAVPKFKRLGIETIRDLLWHFPSRYEDFSQLTEIADITDKGQVVSVRGVIRSIEVSRAWRRRMVIVNAEVEDDTGSIRVVWFNQPYIADMLSEGTVVSLSGKVTLDKQGLCLSSPSYEKATTDLKHTGRLVPVYPETQGITSKYIRFLLKPILNYLKTIPDPLPEGIIKKYKFPEALKALRDIHFPDEIDENEKARNRFAFQELMLFQLRALLTRKKMHTLKASQIKFDKDLVADFVKKLPFKLTDDQRVATFEILQDIEKTYPMNRLLNGDVGAGKTIVALIAAYQVVQTEHQTVLMAPTEILAKQHFNTIISILTGGSKRTKIPNIKVGLLTGSHARQWPTDEITEEKISKKLMHEKIKNGEFDIVIGTHAVIQKDVAFKSLGLVVIDEQHRFGIEQRMKLVKTKGLVPHLLSMTATPIPRSLALTIYGDLDVSLIKQKPQGRREISTKVISNKKRDEAYKSIDKEIASGRQVFVICPRIELSKVNGSSNGDELDPSKPVSQAKLMWAEVKAVTDEFEKLSKNIFPHRRLAMLHGKLKPKEKEKIMSDFRDGVYDMLVSTSVIEVGVDVPNATIMMIESAERFGLAQLHQFRGRVGRGEHQSHCLLFTSSGNGISGQRLRSMEKISSGFELAEIDLKLRGPGEFAGVKQSGMPDLTMSSLANLELIKKTRAEAQALLKQDPTLKKHPLLLIELSKMQRMVHFE